MRNPTKRLRAKKRNQSMLAGITWYNDETWARVKADAADPERLEDSFPRWEAMAVSALRELLRSGVRAVKFQVIPEELFAWCASNNKTNNAESRAEFVSEMLSAACNKNASPIS